MTEFLRYHLDNALQINMDMPNAVFDRAMTETRLPEILSHDLNLVSYAALENGARLTLNKQPFKEHQWDSSDAEAAVSQWLYALIAARKNAADEYIDPTMDVHMHMDSLGDLSGQNRLPFQATLSWPIESPDQAARLATKAMRDTALTVGYLDESIQDAAYATVSHDHGVEFQSLDIACCCVGTDGMSFNPNANLIELEGHNLYNRQVVVTCFAGLVAASQFRRR